MPSAILQRKFSLKKHFRDETLATDCQMDAYHWGFWNMSVYVQTKGCRTRLYSGELPWQHLRFDRSAFSCEGSLRLTTSTCCETLIKTWIHLISTINGHSRIKYTRVASCLYTFRLRIIRIGYTVCSVVNKKFSSNSPLVDRGSKAREVYDLFPKKENIFEMDGWINESSLILLGFQSFFMDVQITTTFRWKGFIKSGGLPSIYGRRVARTGCCLAAILPNACESQVKLLIRFGSVSFLSSSFGSATEILLLS